ncbi:WD repeat-containing protein 60 [Acyrthosiphon pisum]|uniref:WD repeat-containing protein 60 n=1 Tax=Acyrthosiphon pisum TaxID=7029 RepID=A0A8R1W8V4_ACYPI|nr:WD repeat-containing protein 60 [Acyrthosiphon pisum]|eukprot:XP_003246105.1 PREDICTED: WD repeat-containing protein 60 [Acyrthosiphon pisum]
MARRTVENFNGFVAATTRTPAKKSTAQPAAASRTKPAVTSTGKKNVPVPAVKATGAAPTAPPIRNKDQPNTHPFAKVEKLQRNVTTFKKLSVDVKNKHVKVSIKQNENKILHKEEKPIDDVDNSTTAHSNSSDVSDNQDYEDDFEDYESDFESDTSVDSLVVESPLKPTIVSQSTSNDTVSVRFALPVCVEEKLEPFLDEKFEINSLERTIEMGLKNFKTAGKRKREQEVKDKILTRGNVLMGMIKLDTVSFTLLDLPAIPYEQYIKMYGRSNMTQVQTQTHDENAEKEVQTNESDLAEKWTQHPIVLTNDMNCSSIEYLKAKRGVGGNEPSDNRLRTHFTVVDPDRVIEVARMMLSMLEQQSMDRSEHRLVANDFDMGFSNGYLSPAVSSLKFLAKRPVTSIEFSRVTSNVESLVTTHEVTDSFYQYVICIWSVSITEHPEYVLKCPNYVTSFCTIFKSTIGFVTAAHVDGSICVWDLRESKLHHQQVNGLPCPLRSPSYNTALSIDQGHRSKIVGLSTVTYNNVTNEELPDELCSLDEDFVLAVWTVVDSWADISEISENKNAGTAPWSSVRLVKTQTINANKNVPRYLSDGVTATCLCLNNNQDAFIGTNCGLVFRCNLGGHKVWPSYFTYENTGEHFSVNSLDICPFDLNFFLAACSSNEVMLYSASRREALRRLFASSKDGMSAQARIVKALWCTGNPGIVFGLDSFSSVHMWDLCDDITTPIMSVPFRGKAVTAMSLTSMPKNQNTYLGLAFADGSVELHQLKLDKRNETVDRSDQLTRFLASL